MLQMLHQLVLNFITIITLNLSTYISLLYYSFALATETKSGCLVKTLGKFSTCISGQPKSNKGRKENTSVLSSTMNSTMNTTEADSTRTSLVINTSDFNDMSTECETTFTRNFDEIPEHVLDETTLDTINDKTE